MPEEQGFTGKIIRKMCDEKSITVAELERTLGLANATIARWEKGAAPNSAALQKVADYFHTTVDYLLGRTEERDTFEHWNKKYGAKDLSKQVKQIETIAAHLGDTQLDENELNMLEMYLKALVKNKQK